MDSDEIQRLAKSGGLCACGGVHVPQLDYAILASLTDLPFCECEDCRICAPVREALEALQAETANEDTNL